jgi:hypothetical protein
MALPKKDRIGIKPARLADRCWNHPCRVAIKACFRHWDNPAPWVNSRIKVARVSGGAGAPARPRPRTGHGTGIGGMRGAAANKSSER